MPLKVLTRRHVVSLNESPSEKEGKFHTYAALTVHSSTPLNESPSEKEGKWLPAGRV